MNSENTSAASEGEWRVLQDFDVQTVLEERPLATYRNFEEEVKTFLRNPRVQFLIDNLYQKTRKILTTGEYSGESMSCEFAGAIEDTIIREIQSPRTDGTGMDISHYLRKNPAMQRRFSRKNSDKQRLFIDLKKAIRIVAAVFRGAICKDCSKEVIQGIHSNKELVMIADDPANSGDYSQRPRMITTG